MKKRYLQVCLTIVCLSAAGICYSCGGPADQAADSVLILEDAEGKTGSGEDAEEADPNSDAGGKAGSAAEAREQSGSGPDAEGKAGSAAGGKEQVSPDTDARGREQAGSDAGGKAGSAAEAREQAGSGPDAGGKAGSAVGADEANAGQPSLQAAEAASSRPSESAAVLYVHICGEVNHPGVYGMEEGSRVFQAVEKAGGFTDRAAESYLNMARPVTDGMKIVVPSLEDLETLSGNGAENLADGGAKEAAVSGSAGIYGPDGVGIWEDSRPSGGGSVGSGSGAGDSGGTGSSTGSGSTGGSGTGGGSGPGGGKVNLNTADQAALMTLKGIGEARAADIIAYREQNGPFQKIEDVMKVSGIKEAAFEKMKDYITVG